MVDHGFLNAHRQPGQVEAGRRRLRPFARELPVRKPTRYTTTANLKTGMALGLGRATSGANDPKRASGVLLQLE
jgi:hypothetical protein